MDNYTKKKCFVCQNLGRIRHDDDPNDRYNPIPLLYCFKITRCCDKYIYVHDTVQQNPDIVLDCGIKINEILLNAFNRGICFVCKKRLYLNIWEKLIIGCVALFMMLIIGSMINPDTSFIIQIFTGFFIILGCIFVTLSLMVGVLFYKKDSVTQDGYIEFKKFEI